MKPIINFQVIKDTQGRPAFVFIPYDDFINAQEGVADIDIPREVVSKHLKGMTMLQAWREYLKLSQKEVADRMGITAPGYGQIETSKRPRQITLEKVANALGITLDQLEY
jgi:predicted transcriptional regulator